MKRRHVLVVESERATLTLLQRTLTGAGFRVTGVLDGISALKAARADAPDLVLLDPLIPGVDGYGVCALLKQGSCVHAPIAMLSGRTGERDIRAAEAAGAVAVLPMPIDRRTLVAKIPELLAGVASPGKENQL